jgi:hypothetical protein
MCVCVCVKYLDFQGERVNNVFDFVGGVV